MTESVTKEFSYGDNVVTFQDHNGIKFVNLTEMFAGFPGRELRTWQRSKRTKELKTALEERIGTIQKMDSVDNEKVMFSVAGGDYEHIKPGTWAIEELALDAAMYMSPEFHLWVLDRIKELVTTGATSILKPKADAYDNFLLCGDSMLVGDVAQVTGVVGRNKLYAILREKKILNRDNQPYQKYVDKGYFDVRINKVGRSLRKTTCVTAKGLEFIKDLLIKKGFNIEKANDLSISFKKEYEEVKDKLQSMDTYIEYPFYSSELPVFLKNGSNMPARQKKFALPGIGTVIVSLWSNNQVTLSRQRGRDFYNFVVITPDEPRQYAKGLGYLAQYNFDKHEFSLIRIKKVEKEAA